MSETTNTPCCQEIVRIPLIGEKAPSFEAVTTQGKISFPDDYKGKWVILFSHPADFTPVCTTEFMTFASMADRFQELNCELLGLSIDSNFSHIAWVRTIEEKIEYKDMKQVHIGFPIIADLTMEVAHRYGMVHPGSSSTQAVRASSSSTLRRPSVLWCITRSRTDATSTKSSVCSLPCRPPTSSR